MKPFLLLQMRPETEASDDEYEAFLRNGDLDPARVRRIRLDRETPDDLVLDDYAGVIVGGGPGCVSDDPATKDPVEARIEDLILGLMPEITTRDMPFLGCCYGISVLAHHLGTEVSKARFGEPVSASDCEVTDAGRDDPLLSGLPDAWGAFVGHKEAVQRLPDGCTHLVRSDRCPYQMIRFGDNVYATQFHPEADAASFETRVHIYKDRGYFPPETAEDLIAMIRSCDVTVPGEILRRFVARYG